MSAPFHRCRTAEGFYLFRNRDTCPPYVPGKKGVRYYAPADRIIKCADEKCDRYWIAFKPAAATYGQTYAPDVTLWREMGRWETFRKVTRHAGAAAPTGIPRKT